jgi:hypothetical protein
MQPAVTAPLLPGLAAGLMLGLLAWASLRQREARTADSLMKSHDGVLAGLAVLAVFALAAFVVYMALGIGF